MPLQIDELISKHRKFLNERKDEITSSQNTGNDEYKVTSELARTKPKEVDESELLIISEQLLYLDNMSADLPQSTLRISPVVVYHPFHSDSKIKHYSEKFYTNLWSLTYNRVEHLKISSDLPSPYPIWDYVRDNNALKTLFIDSEHFRNEFVAAPEFSYNLNSALNLFYIKINIAEEPLPDAYSEITAEQLKKILSYGLSENKSCLIDWRDGIHSAVFIKNANTKNIIEYHLDHSYSLTEDDFIKLLASANEFHAGIILKGIYSEIIKCRKENESSYYSYSWIKNIKIDGSQQFDGWHLIDYAASYDDILSAELLINMGANLDLENNDGETPLLLASQKASDEMLRILLGISLPLSDSGIVLHTKGRELIEQTNREGDTPLIAAVKRNMVANVVFLIRCGANLSHQNLAKETAIEIAFKRCFWDIVYYLLQAGTPFPNNFDFRLLPNEAVRLNAFIREINKLSEDLKNGNIDLIKSSILDNKLTRTFRNINNESAPYIAFTNNQYELYILLRSKGFSFYENEALDFKSMNEDSKQAFQSAMVKYIYKPNFTTVTYLMSKTRILQTDPRYYEHIRQAYEELSNIPIIQVILETIEHSLFKLDIIFDFESDNVQEVAGTDSDAVSGLYDPNDGRIFIAAKRELKDFYGTIAHELAHKAMYIVFNNNCNPYYGYGICFTNKENDRLREDVISGRVIAIIKQTNGSKNNYKILYKRASNNEILALIASEELSIILNKCNFNNKIQPKQASNGHCYELIYKAMSNANGSLPYDESQVKVIQEYNNIIKELEERKDLDPIIDSAITSTSYKNKGAVPSEVIVRIPHMLAKYGDKQGKVHLQKQAQRLLDFYIMHIDTACRDYIIKSKMNITGKISPEAYLLTINESKIKQPSSRLKKYVPYIAGGISIVVPSVVFLYELYSKRNLNHSRNEKTSPNRSSVPKG